MKAEIRDGTLHIEILADTANPRPSKSGKTRIIASTNGNVTTTVIVKGMPVVIGLNAYIKG